MTSQITDNCHFVSRFLTKPWETQDRFLRFYDFAADRFGKKSSRSLFAEDSLNSSAVEAWLDRTIETPLGAVRDRIAMGELELLRDDWKRYRAALLLLWLQGTRSRSVRNVASRAELDRLASRSEKEVDDLAFSLQKDFDLRLVPTAHDEARGFAPLYISSSGIFPMVIPDTGCQSGFSIGLGLPLAAHCALLATPVEREGQLDLSRMTGSIANYSVGTNANLVVILPAVIEQHGEAETRRILLDLRAHAKDLIEQTNGVKQLVIEMFAESGLEARVDGAGRISPKQT